MKLGTRQLPFVAAGTACVAAVVQSFAPLWVFLPVIVLSLSCSAVGLVMVRRQQKRAVLEAKMRAAFGPSMASPMR